MSWTEGVGDEPFGLVDPVLFPHGVRCARCLNGMDFFTLYVVVAREEYDEVVCPDCAVQTVEKALAG